MLWATNSMNKKIQSFVRCVVCIWENEAARIVLTLLYSLASRNFSPFICLCNAHHIEVMEVLLTRINTILSSTSHCRCSCFITIESLTHSHRVLLLVVAEIVFLFFVAWKAFDFFPFVFLIFLEPSYKWLAYLGHSFKFTNDFQHMLVVMIKSIDG